MCRYHEMSDALSWQAELHDGSRFLFLSSYQLGIAVVQPAPACPCSAAVCAIPSSSAGSCSNSSMAAARSCTIGAPRKSCATAARRRVSASLVAGDMLGHLQSGTSVSISSAWYLAAIGILAARMGCKLISIMTLSSFAPTLSGTAEQRHMDAPNSYQNAPDANDWRLTRVGQSRLQAELHRELPSTKHMVSRGMTDGIACLWHHSGCRKTYASRHGGEPYFIWCAVRRDLQDSAGR